MKIYSNKLMENMLSSRRDVKLPEKLKKFLKAPAFQAVGGCVFFSKRWEKTYGDKPNIRRYGDTTGCEASINGIHLADFCEKGDDVISVAFVFAEEFLKRWTSEYQQSVTLIMGFVSSAEEFGPDVSFTFHQTRPDVFWIDPSSIEKSSGALLVMES